MPAFVWQVIETLDSGSVAQVESRVYFRRTNTRSGRNSGGDRGKAVAIRWRVNGWCRTRMPRRKGRPAMFAGGSFEAGGDPLFAQGVAGRVFLSERLAVKEDFPWRVGLL